MKPLPIWIRGAYLSLDLFEISFVFAVLEVAERV